MLPLSLSSPRERLQLLTLLQVQVVRAQATARIENISSGTHGAIFNITIFGPNGVTPLINLMGVADSVASGETQSISFVTTDGDLPSGQFKYAFQTSTEL